MKKAKKGKGTGKGKAEKATTPKAKTVEKSIFNHRIGTLASAMDSALASGGTMDEMVAKVSKESKKTPERCRAALRQHITYLRGRNVSIIEKGDTFKATLNGKEKP